MINELITGTLALVKNNLNYLKKIEDLPSRQVLKENFVQLAASAPCVFGIYEGGAYAPPRSTTIRQKGSPGIVLATITTSLRDPLGSSASRGGTNKGAYEILDDLRSALLGKTPAAGFGQLYLTSEGLFAMKNGTVVYISLYRANVQIKPKG